MFSWVRQEPQQREAMKTEENSALVVATGESWSTVLKRLQCLEQQSQRCSLRKKREDKMCCWLQQEPRLKDARKTTENSALVVATEEGWSTVLKRLQCLEQQRQRCSLRKKREDKMCCWVLQESQQRQARNK